MPLPEPTKGETKEKFISRCMGDKITKKDFPDQKQRIAVCLNQLRQAGRKIPKPKEKMSATIEQKIFSVISNESSASDKGVIKDVSIITVGEAKGHGVLVDQTTLEQVKSASQKFKGGLKVKLDHGSGVESIVGSVKNFRIDGEKLLADLHLLKSHEKYNFILDLIQNMSDTFGISISFSGDNEVIGEQSFARCTEIYSADLVTEPAANPTGLFEENKKPVDKDNNDMDEKQFSDFKSQTEQSITKIFEKLEALEKKFQEPAIAVAEVKVEEKNEDMSAEMAKQLTEAASAAVIRELAKVGVAPVAVVNTDDKSNKPKTFEELVQEKVKGGMDKIKALRECIKNNQKEYREALDRGIASI